MSGLSATFFVLRTPLLPFEVFRSWSDGLEAAEAGEDQAHFSEALDRDRAQLRIRLHDIFARPEVHEALRIASPDLADAFELWVADSESSRGKGVERALVRYFARMAGRPTPFGLFAGVSVGVVGERTNLEIAALPEYRRSSRLDLGYLFALTERLRADPDVRKSLTYRPNGTLYPAGARLRYVESRLEGADLRHELVAVARTDALDSTLARADEGATLEQLAQMLASDRVSLPAAENYMRELVENDLLVPELGISVTGPEPLDELTEELAELRPAQQAAARLDEAREKLRAIDERGIGGDASEYEQIAELLESLQVDHEGPLFQVDMFKPAPKATLGPRVVDELLRGVEALRLLAPAPAETDLDRFRDAFALRYESREVPLREALDPDTGIGFPPARSGDRGEAPLLAGLSFPGEEGRSVRWGAREDLLLRKLAEASRASRHELVLEPHDLERLDSGAKQPLPDSFAVTATLAAGSRESLDRGDFRLLIDFAHGPSGATLLGRFCHGDPELRRYVEAHLRAEEALSPESIFAEVVHLPTGRMGNVTCRPVLRDYEITTSLGRSGAPPDRQIPVDDLLVSLREGKLVLRSARLGRRVIPRLTSAHNFGRYGIPVYRFLAFLQSEGARGGLRWSWDPLAAAPFLPRVRLGRLVLSRAQWNLTQEELRRLAQPGAASGFGEVQVIRNERDLPRLVALQEGDWLLPVDLDNVLSVESLVHVVKSWESANLVEIFPGPDELCVEGPEGSFVHEIVVPFVRVAAEGARAEPSSRAVPSPGPRRRFPPGSEWLSAALYLGPAVADEVLLETIGPLADELVRSGAADRWFFIRYTDPDWHLRVRFHGEPEALRSSVQPALERAGERGWRLRFDTYEREVERYGGTEGIVLAERLFHVDSDAVLDLLRTFAGRDEEERWHAALVGVDGLLADAGLSLEQREALTRELRDTFAKEFHADSTLHATLGERFRKERKMLEAQLTSAESPAWHEVFRHRSDRLAPIFAELRAHEEAGRLSIPPAKLLESYIHMHLNRVLRSAHRKQELVLYDFLARLYRSRIETDGLSR